MVWWSIGSRRMKLDFPELWATNPGMAKMELHAIAPGHKRPEMVAHGLGQWWIGPRLNDFDDFLIKACQKRKRKFQQPDGVGDAKTFINNMLKSGDWGNLLLRCDEAKELYDRSSVVEFEASRTPTHHSLLRGLEISQSDRRNLSTGLAKFKVAQGDYARAREIADLCDLSYETIGLRIDGKEPIATSLED